MKSNTYEKIVCTLFWGFLSVMMLCYLFVPKQDFSELEKRYLEEFPEVSLENIISGDFGEQIESYMADHNPARDFFVGLNAYWDLATGRQNTKEIRLLDGNRLVEEPVTWNESNVQKNLRAINAFADSLEQNVDMMIVPSAGWASGEPYPDEEYIEQIYAGAGEHIDTIDITDIFSGNKEYFYKTDHHWTSLGAYMAYEAYAKHCGQDYKPQEYFTVEEVEGFFGSTYSRSALWLTPGETLELWNGNQNLTVVNGEDDLTHQGVFYRNRLEEADKYTVNLDGNHSIVQITNPDAAGKLLVIRDSYSNSLGTFLAESYGTVILVDLRYYKGSVSELCAQEQVDDILICYSIGNFMTDANIIWLR